MCALLIRFGSEFILSNAKIRCAAAVRAQHGDALGLVTWSWQRGWATSMQPSSFHSLCRPLSSGPSGRSPSAWRQAAAAATRGGSTARLRLAGRGGVIAARRHCEGMQQRRRCLNRWRMRVQFCLRCNAGSEWKIARAPRAAAPAPRGDVCFRRHQQAACLQMAVGSREYQGGPLTKKTKLTNRASVHEITLRGKSRAVSGVHVGCVFQQKAAHVRVTILSRTHQGSVLTKKQMN